MPDMIPITTNIFWSVEAYFFTREISPMPIVFPMITDAAEDAPTAIDFTIRKMLDATLLAAMAAEVI